MCSKTSCNYMPHLIWLEGFITSNNWRLTVGSVFFGWCTVNNGIIQESLTDTCLQHLRQIDSSYQCYLNYWEDLECLTEVCHILRGHFWVVLTNGLNFDVVHRQGHPRKLYKLGSCNLRWVFLRICVRAGNKFNGFPPSKLMEPSVKLIKRQLDRHYTERLQQTWCDTCLLWCVDYIDTV